MNYSLFHGLGGGDALGDESDYLNGKLRIPAC